MKNIGNIAKHDFNKIRNSVIALIVIIGIVIVPALYAWFNIAASWDPYGNTGELKVAVASVDEGYEGSLIPIDLNLGDTVLSKLRENTLLNWVFTDAKDAENGVRSGKYYAALVIPEDFSKNMMSVFSQEAVHPQVAYYINEKENAIVPKVTEKGANALQKQINSAFTETIAQTALDAFTTVADMAESTGDESVTAALSETLARISSDLDSAAETVHAFENMTDSAALMLDTTSGFLKQTGNGASSAANALKTTDAALTSLDASVTGVTDSLSSALSENANFYAAVSASLQNAINSCSSDAASVSAALTSVSGRVQHIIDGYNSLSASLNSLAASHPDNKLLESSVTRITSQITEACERQNRIKAKLDSAASGLLDGTQDISGVKAEIDSLINGTIQSVNAIKQDYEANVKGELKNLSGNMKSCGTSVSSLVSSLRQSASDISGVSGSASSGLGDLKSTLADSAGLLSEASGKLKKAAELLESPDGDSLETLSNILSQEPAAVASFAASPVSLNETKIYPVENYGSAMAPFYSTLALWVGGIVLAAMLKTELSEELEKKFPSVKPHEVYIGRGILFLAVGLLQSTLTCLGDLFFLEIQCEHPFLFLLSGWLTSIVYVTIIYTLTVSFGDVGKAVCVVLLVMQVAGSGGTFPIETAPAVFRAVYPLLAFPHSMNAMRECIAGMYGTIYVKEMLALAAFLIPALLLGLVLRKPVIRLNKAFTEKLESTHLI